MSDLPETFDLYWMQTLGGGGDVVRRDIPVSEALAVLQVEQMRALAGEYGAGVFVYLRPSGEMSLPAALAALDRERQLVGDITRDCEQRTRELNNYITRLRREKGASDGC